MSGDEQSRRTVGNIGIPGCSLWVLLLLALTIHHVFVIKELIVSYVGMTADSQFLMNEVKNMVVDSDWVKHVF